MREHCYSPYTEADFQRPGGEITVLLAKWKAGEPSALWELIRLVYPHLREVAAAYACRERNPDLLQGAALVRGQSGQCALNDDVAWIDIDGPESLDLDRALNV
jgi:hypothetical protein